MGWELSSDIASFYHRLGNEKKYNEIISQVEPQCLDLINSGQANMNSYYNPYRVLLDIYETKKEYNKSLDLLKTLSTMYPNDPGLKQRIGEVQAQLGQVVPKTDSTKKN